MQNIISLLQHLGFSQYEARVYLALLQQADVSGYELAKISGVAASKIYPVLNKLHAKGIIRIVQEEPVRYVPLHPDDLLSDLQGNYNQTVHALSDKLNKIYDQDKLEDNYIWHLTGRKAIIRKIREFLNSAGNDIYLSVWDEEITEIEHLLKEAAARKIKLVIVHFGSRILNTGSEFRHGHEHKIRIERGGRRIVMIVDDKKVILGHFREDGSCHAAWTTDTGLALLAKDYIIHDIYSIRVIEKYGREAVDMFSKI